MQNVRVFTKDFERFPLSGFRQASMFRILESKLKINSSSNEGSTLSSVKGKINFEHVSFKYSTRLWSLSERAESES
uniref:Uncharacterized protein n=1 Tax=Kalanchoe fedtschenkoi TaxID=63787 RepID=A0A7N0VIR8_KALFE